MIPLQLMDTQLVGMTEVLPRLTPTGWSISTKGLQQEVHQDHLYSMRTTVLLVSYMAEAMTTSTTENSIIRGIIAIQEVAAPFPGEKPLSIPI